MTEIWQEDRYRQLLRTRAKSGLLTEIWREAYQQDYPEEADPLGFVTLSELELIASELRLRVESRLADLGCGRGGPGLWVARRTSSLLTGIDILAEAVEQACHLRDSMGLSHAATFTVGSFSDTGLASQSQQAVMSVDAFWMVLDKPAAIREMARVLVPGGRVAMTTWVSRQVELEGMLRAFGFRLLSFAETPRWKERQIAVYRGILRNREEIELEIGRESAAVLISEAREAPEKLARAPRRLVLAEKRL